MPRLSIARVPAVFLAVYRDTSIDKSAHIVAASSTTEQVIAATNAIAINTTNSGLGSFYLDPAWWPSIQGRSPKLRLIGEFATNTVDMGASFAITFALKAFGTYAGAAASDLRTAVPGAAAGSVVVTGNAASSLFTNTSADFDPPAAGHYIITATANQAAAANSTARTRIRLQQRWV